MQLESIVESAPFQEGGEFLQVPVDGEDVSDSGVAVGESGVGVPLGEAPIPEHLFAEGAELGDDRDPQGREIAIEVFDDGQMVVRQYDFDSPGEVLVDMALEGICEIPVDDRLLANGELFADECVGSGLGVFVTDLFSAEDESIFEADSSVVPIQVMIGAVI